MSTPIAIYLIPLYIILLCGLVNYIAIRTSSTLRARLSRSTRIRYLIPYPLILIGLPPTTLTTSSGTTPNGNTNNVNNARQTAQRRIRPGTGPGTGGGITGWLQGQARRGMGTADEAGSGGAGNGNGGDPLTDLMARNLGIARPGRAAATTAGTTANTSTNNARSAAAPATATTTTTTTNPRTGRVITRGGRRWGRTGSQRSTQTLPLYEEDAGEEDVVLIRKRESLREAGRGDEGDIAEHQMEDVDDDEDDEGGDDPGSEEDVERRASLLPSHNSTSTSTSTSNDVTGSGDQDPLGDNEQRRTRASSVSTSDIPDRGWGEAPSYDVAVPPPRFDFDLDAESRPAGTSTGAGGGGRGGFRAFVGRLTGGRAEQHRRGYSNGSAGPDDDRAGLMRMSTAGTVMTMGRNRGWSNASSIGAGRNVSGSTTPGMMSQVSLASNTAGPTMSRFSSRLSSFGGAGTGGNTSTMTSASSSVTNLNLNGPISAPLPGSLIRSSFDAPRAGFSAKQVEFLSSTESLGKYGVRVDEDGNPIPIAANPISGRARGSSVGSMSMSLARASVDEGNGTRWRALAREERAAGNVPAPLSIQVPSIVPGGELEIEVVPPTPVLTT